MKIFISYRRTDSKYVIDRIRDRLIAEFGRDSVFRDIDDIPAGEDFREVLENQIIECDVMLVVIGPQWAGITDAQGNRRLFDSKDFTRIEVETGLQNEGIAVISVLVMNAPMPSIYDLPESLVNLPKLNAIPIRNDPDFDKDIQKLISGIKSIQRPVDTRYLEYFEPETVFISKGSFWMGSDPADGIPSFETPRHEVLLPAYRIGKYPVTNAQYEEFVREMNHSVTPGMGWDGQRVPKGVENFPVVGVTWYDAMAYCEWLSKKTGRSYALPNEAQWEKACRGGKDVLYPWGNEMETNRSNHGKSTLAAVDAHPAQNEYGCYDFVGNIQQWTCTLWGEKRNVPDPKYAYPWRDDERNNLSAGRQIRRVVRGSSFQDDVGFMRCSARRGQLPDDSGSAGALLGFRIVMLISQSSSDETKVETEITTPAAEESEEERALRLQTAIEANRLTNNRSQPVFNDRAQGEDQLGIKDEVEALAETLLLRDVEPPVAVGVMGGWGSGKSFVMYLISKFIEETRAKKVKKGWSDDKNDPEIPAYVGHIYQINFNAWTYAKSNLWASLMDTIFLNLNRQMQLEQLLAHRDCSPTETSNLAVEVHNSMLEGGEVFKKIYGENIHLDQDQDLKDSKDNLNYWAHHLFKGNLLWSVMRHQQEEDLNRLKNTEEQLSQLKARREQFEKNRSREKSSIKLDPASEQAYLQTLKSVMLASISDALSEHTKDELTKQGLTEDEVQNKLKEAKGLLGVVNTIIATYRENKIYWLLTPLFLVVTFLVPYLLSTFRIDFIQRGFAQALSLFLTALPLITAILSWAQKMVTFNAEAEKIREGAYKMQQAKSAEKIANSPEKSPAQKISELHNEISQGSLAAYDILIGLLEAQAEAQRQLLGPSAKYSNLMEFVQSRLDAATYENQLGLMHQVRQDIDELTYSLVDNASKEVFPRGKPRVVLYIDDLDRCPPARVVEVLEAVQLLLNTKLFIVILGLDTRYITRALEKEYKEILQHEGDPSGLDYIEKIIQIPYRVRSIEPNSLRNYLKQQMDIEKLIEQTAASSTPQAKPEVAETKLTAPVQSSEIKTSPIETEQKESVADTVQIEPAEATSEISSKGKQQEPELPEEPKPLEIELPAAVIQFKQDDLDDLAVCCQKIVLTPRSIKRMVNVFKLMKIFWFRADKDAGFEERDRPRSVKQAAMCLLALSSAYPEVMREAFVHLETLYRQGQEQTELFTALNSVALPPGSAHELSWQLKKYKGDLAALKALAGNGQDNFGQITLQTLMLSTFNIVRSFSFVGDPVYWTNGEDFESTKIVSNQPIPTAKLNRNQ